MRPTGLFAGRFQPFHNGHLAIIEQMNDECDNIIIVIGSAQQSHTPDNPFTAGERYEMINETLRESDIQHEYYIIPVQDLNRYDLWVKHVQSLCPPFTVAYANSPFIQQLFLEAGLEVVTPAYTTISKGSSTRLTATFVRDAMSNFLNLSDWKDFVPIGTQEVIKRIDGIKRLRMISRGD